MANTPLLGLTLPTTGTLSGTWGDVVNAEITTLLDSAIAGTTTLSSDTDVTLTTTVSASNQARQAILLCTGARTVMRTITAPAQSKTYIVINDTTGGFDVKLVGVGPTTGVIIPSGGRALVAWNGSDFVVIESVTLTGTQTLSNKTLLGVILNDGYTEEVFAVTGTTPALSPTNGSIQTWTLTAASTPTAGTWAAGQSLTLMIDDGTAYTVTWTSLAVTWKTDGGLAPLLNLTGYTAIQLWKVGAVIYGARVGNA